MFRVDNMNQLFQDIHIDSIMTFLKEINLFRKKLILLFLKSCFSFIFVLAYNRLHSFLNSIFRPSY